MKLVNLTPHPIVLMRDGQSVAIPTSGTVARCGVTRERVGAVPVEGLDLPINRTRFGAVEGLPPEYRCPHCNCRGCDGSCPDVQGWPGGHLEAGGCVYSLRGGAGGTPCDHEPRRGYIVSSVVAQAVAGTRDDVLVPDDLVRDEQGRVIGARALARV